MVFNYNEHCGNKKNFLSEDKLSSIVSYMEKLDSTNIPEGSCKGIDVNHTEAYSWFIENLLNPLREYTGRSDLGLIFGFLGDVTQSFRIHRDVKTIPENEQNPNGTQFASFLIPLSVDRDPTRCATNSTMVFELDVLDEPAEEQPWHYLVKGTNPLVEKEVYGMIDHTRYTCCSVHYLGHDDNTICTTVLGE